MFANLVMGTLLMVINLGIQVLAVSFLISYFSKRINAGETAPSIIDEAKALSVVMAVLMLGHFFMFATWAILLTTLGEFGDFATAFYHSTVNFTSLGYGDIVMSEQHRLLGALEAANGVLMFGLSAGAILSVMNGMFSRRKTAPTIKEKLNPGK
jgi:voltage-gated potassium channel Kch